MSDGPTATMTKFGHPRTLVAETERWMVLARPEQVTLGSLVLICREPVTAFGAASPAAFAEMGEVVARIEACLRNFVRYEKINYLMLMMVDPDVHCHVIPRYDGTRRLDGLEVEDAAWPGPPVLGTGVEPDAATMAGLVAELRRHWLAA